MTLSARLLTLVLGLSLPLGCGPAASEKETLCFDNKDDDGNGLVDCADPACVSVAGCGGGQGDGGANWGSQCTEQLTCLAMDRAYRTSPLSTCVRGNCVTNEGVVVRLTVNGSAYSGVTDVKALSVRVVSKRAVDDSSVTCQTLIDASPSTVAADADQLATSKKFNLRAWDTVPLDLTQGFNFEVSRLRMNTGKDYLLWLEMWTGSRNGTTYLPTGTRRGYTCIDDLAEVVLEDDLDNGSTPRNISVTLVAPQNP